MNHFETLPTQIRIDAAITDAIVEHVQPLLEEWAGIALEHKNTEGIRCYHNGSRCVPAGGHCLYIVCFHTFHD